MTALESVLQSIKKQSGYTYIVKKDILLKANKVTLDIKDVTVAEALIQSFKDQPFTYIIDGKIISIITPAVDLAPRLSEDGLSNLSPSLETPPITGTMLGPDAQPMAGVSITDKATGKGTITNAKGQFTLSGTATNTTLRITYVGYEPVEINVSENEGRLKVFMEPGKNELDKVIVQGYGTTTARLTTSNIATGNCRGDRKAAHHESFTCFAGKGGRPGCIAGKWLCQCTDKSGIKGRSAMSLSSRTFPVDPLYVVDGVPLTVSDISNSNNYTNGSTGFIQNAQGFIGPAGGQSPLFSINPSDIRKYRSTQRCRCYRHLRIPRRKWGDTHYHKKGKAGKTQFDLRVQEGVIRVTRFYDMLNTAQYLRYVTRAFANDQHTYPDDPRFTPGKGNAYDFILWDTTRYTSWQKKCMARVCAYH